jgi:hypothetical protein
VLARIFLCGLAGAGIAALLTVLAVGLLDPFSLVFGLAGLLLPIPLLVLPPILAGALSASQGRSSAAAAGGVASTIAWTLWAGPALMVRLQAPIYSLRPPVDKDTLKVTLAAAMSHSVGAGFPGELLAIGLGVALAIGVAHLLKAPSTEIEGIRVLIPMVSVLVLVANADIAVVSAAMQRLAETGAPSGGRWYQQMVYDLPVFTTQALCALTLAALAALLAGRLRHPRRAISLGPRIAFTGLGGLSLLGIPGLWWLSHAMALRSLPLVGAALIVSAVVYGGARAREAPARDPEVLRIDHVAYGGILGGIAWMIVQGIGVPALGLSLGTGLLLGQRGGITPMIDVSHLLWDVLRFMDRTYVLGFLAASTVAFVTGGLFAMIDRRRA